MAARAWMQAQYHRKLIDNAWIISAHIERDGIWTAEDAGGYNVEHFRDFNNAAPDVCYGFEGAPGHQVNHFRGFGNTVTCDPVTLACTSKDFGGTYGGVGYYTAKVGGLWDALLGEGRRWLNYANSDYHRHYRAGGDDFYPGECQKTWVKVRVANTDDGRPGERWTTWARTERGKQERGVSLNDIADGLRSGNAYFVHGDLIELLELTAQAANQQVSTGGELLARKPVKEVELTIKFRSPAANNCAPGGAIR